MFHVMHPDLPTLASPWGLKEDVTPFPRLFSVSEESSARSIKDRSQTEGTGKRNKRVIERGAMRTRDGQTPMKSCSQFLEHTMCQALC